MKNTLLKPDRLRWVFFIMLSGLQAGCLFYFIRHFCFWYCHMHGLEEALFTGSFFIGLPLLAGLGGLQFILSDHQLNLNLSMLLFNYGMIYLLATAAEKLCLRSKSA